MSIIKSQNLNEEKIVNAQTSINKLNCCRDLQIHVFEYL